MSRLAVALVLASIAGSAAAAPCPRATGDLAPGTLLGGSVPTFSPAGDGLVNVADVVVALREAVGLHVVDGALVGGDCASLPADLAPGELDASTDPPTWRPRGNGVVDVADAIVELRASTGLVRLAPLPVRDGVKLESGAGCEDLAAWMREAALAEFAGHGTWGSAWWWGRWGGGPMVDHDGDGSADPTPASGEGAATHSTTNVQVAGVDEPDLVKTDGTLLVAIGSGQLRVLRAWPVESLSHLASVPIEGSPTGLFLDRGRAVVLSATYQAPSPVDIGVADFVAPWGSTKISVFDLSVPVAPFLEREIYVDGWLRDVRRLDGRSVLVLYHAVHGPGMPAWTGDQASWDAAVRAALESSTAEDWLPQVADVRHARDGSTTVVRRYAVDCATVRRPPDLLLTGLVNVVETDLVAPGAWGSATIAGTASTVRVGRKRLLVTTDDWGASGGSGAGFTRVHAFSIGGAELAPRYVGSGTAPGCVATQWSIDDTGDQVRLATMRRDPSGRPCTDVHVLVPDGTGDLGIAGSIECLAPGETLQSARFVGDRGYLVTFERKDPLWVLDLADAAHPAVEGELVVPGFSSYLHPLREHRLIGIGREIDPVTQAQLGMQVSLFDVSAPSAPLLQDRVVEATGWDGSEAEWDPHAFTYWEPLSLLAVPIATWSGADWASRVQLYRITPESGVARAGSALVPDGSCARPRRAVFLEDRLLAVTDAGVSAYRAAEPGTIVSTVEYPDWPGCGFIPGGTDGSGGSGGSEPAGP